MVYCPLSAIIQSDGKTFISQDRCVDCSVCKKSGICAEKAFFMPKPSWPRLLRARFSDPLVSHPSTGVVGRGTTEMKTNDVTGRFKKGEIGFAVEVGRPGVSARLKDVETIAMSLAGHVQFEKQTPVSDLIDLKTGRLKDRSIGRERVLSAIIECKTLEKNTFAVLEKLKKISADINTVFSLCVIFRHDEDSSIMADMESQGFVPRINGKVNVGLGRPLV